MWGNPRQVLLTNGSILVRQVQLLMLWNTAECVSHHMQRTFPIPHIQRQFLQFFQHRSLPTTQVRLRLQMQQGFVVGIHDSALAIQVAPPPLTGFVNGKEFFVDNGPVAFRRRVFCTKILHRVQLPIGFLQKHCANRIVTCIRVNYEFLVKSR